MQVAKRLNAVGIVTPLHKHSCHFHGTIHHGAEHTTYQAGYLPDNEVFSCPEFLLNAVLRRFYTGFGAGSVYPQGRRHGFVHVLKPSPIFALNRHLMVFEAHKGVKTMTILTPELGNFHHAPHHNGKLLFVAAILGILCTFAIFTYSIDNLNALGLSPEIKKARTIEFIVFIFGEVFLSLAIGRIYKTHPTWAYKLAAVWFILLVIDFWGSYQARNAISLQQTLTQSAQKEHAGLIAKQLAVNHETAKELSDSSARQRANKMITGSAQSAMQAAKQADAGLALVDKHAAAIKDIRPTEADTFGEWNGTVIFLAVFSLYALNTAMWGLIGDFSNGVIAPNRNDSVTPQTVQTPAPALPPAPTQNADANRADSVTPDRNDSVTPPAPTSALFDLEKAKEAVRRKNALERMPKVIPWQFAVPAVVATAATPLAATAATPPVMPVMDATANRADSVTPQRADLVTPKAAKAPRKRAENGVQMDTGIEGKASHRYKRVRALIDARKVRPSIRAVAAIKGEQINHDRAKKYLFAMCDDGLLLWNEDKKRFEYRPEVDPRQIELGGL